MSKKRIKSSINRIIGFYYNAIRYRLKYRYSFFKYSLFIPIKFITKTFSKQLKNKNLVHEWKILESEIVMKDGTIFYANNLVFFFEQFHDKIYEELPEFMVKKGMTIIDCGAASGEYTLYALQKGANLIAFEPEKKAINNLKKKTNKYKNVKFFNLAL